MRLQRVMFEEAYPRVPAGKCERQAFVSGEDGGAPVSLDLAGEIITYAYDGRVVWQCHQSKARFWEPAYDETGAPEKAGGEAVSDGLIGRDGKPLDGFAAWLRTPVDADAAQVAAYGAGSVAEDLSSVGGSMLPLEPYAEPATVAEYAADPDTTAPPTDAFEVLSDAVGSPMRRVELEVDKVAQNVNAEVDETPSLEPRVKPVDSVKPSRKERRRSRR